MRIVDAADQQLEARPMRRALIKKLTKHGVGYVSFNVAREDFDTVMDAVLEDQFDKKRLDELTVPELLALFNAVIAETYSTPGEEKNSKTSGPTDQTKTE